MQGLKLYFDHALSKMLLYRFERQQYADLRKEYGDDARMSDLYGCEHLLRLIGTPPRAPQPARLQEGGAFPTSDSASPITSARRARAVKLPYILESAHMSKETLQLVNDVLNRLIKYARERKHTVRLTPRLTRLRLTETESAAPPAGIWPPTWIGW